MNEGQTTGMRINLPYQVTNLDPRDMYVTRETQTQTPHQNMPPHPHTHPEPERYDNKSRREHSDAEDDDNEETNEDGEDEDFDESGDGGEVQEEDVRMLQVNDIKVEDCNSLPYQIVIAQAQLDKLTAQQQKAIAQAQLQQITGQNPPKKPRNTGPRVPRPKGFPCNECDYAATTNSYLQKHKKVRHEGVKFPYTPANNYATVTFDAQGNIIQEPKKLRQCDQCNFVAVKASSMKHHRRVKHEGKVYPCDQCEYLGSTTNNLKLHKMSKHEGVRYPCNECDYASTLPSDLVKHVRNKHDGIRHACSHCTFEATTMSSLRQHVRYKHEGVRFLCDRCDYAATTSSNLTKHKLSSNCLLRRAEKDGSPNNKTNNKPTAVVVTPDTKSFLFPITSIQHEDSSSIGMADGKVQDGRASNESHHPENGTHKDAQPHDARNDMMTPNKLEAARCSSVNSVKAEEHGKPGTPMRVNNQMMTPTPIPVQNREINKHMRPIDASVRQATGQEILAANRDAMAANRDVIMSRQAGNEIMQRANEVITAQRTVMQSQSNKQPIRNVHTPRHHEVMSPAQRDIIQAAGRDLTSPGLNHHPHAIPQPQILIDSHHQLHRDNQAAQHLISYQHQIDNRHQLYMQERHHGGLVGFPQLGGRYPTYLGDRVPVSQPATQGIALAAPTRGGHIMTTQAHNQPGTQGLNVSSPMGGIINLATTSNNTIAGAGGKMYLF